MPITLNVSDIVAVHRAASDANLATLTADSLSALVDALIEAGEYALATRVLSQAGAL